MMTVKTFSPAGTIPDDRMDYPFNDEQRQDIAAYFERLERESLVRVPSFDSPSLHRCLMMPVFEDDSQ